MTRNKKGQFVSDGITGKNNPRWSGNNVGYFGLHTWVKRKLGSAKVCEQCGSVKNVWWANKSHEYKRCLDDWLSLCAICHRKHDNITKIDYEQMNQLVNSGYKQHEIAKIFNCNQSSISKAIKRIKGRELCPQS